MGMVRRRAGMVAGIVLAWCACASALDPSLDISQYSHTAWKVRDGFFRSGISSIAQTPDGYLWLGTQFGLLRFDGVRAVPWQPPAAEQLPSNYIHSLLVSRDGTLWIGTREGLTSWKDGKLTVYPELAHHTTYALLEDDDGAIWAPTEVLGVSPMQPSLCAVQRGRAQCYGQGDFRAPIGWLYEDSRRNLWVGGADGLWRWRPGPPRRYQTSRVHRVVEADNGVLIVAEPDGLKQLVNGEIEKYPLPGIGFQFTSSRLLRSSDGSLWIGTFESGLIHLHQGRVDWFTKSDGLSGTYIVSIFEDREGNVWVGTNDGLDRFRGLAVPAMTSEQGLDDVTYSVVAARDGSVWFGSASGVSRWKDGQTTLYYKPNTKKPNLPPQPGSSRNGTQMVNNSGLPGPALSIFQEHAGQIWMTTEKGVVRWDGRQFVHLNGVPCLRVYAMAEDPQNTVWISDVNEGLFGVSSEGKIEKIPWSSLGHSDYALAMAGDPRQGGLWLGFARNGLAYWKDGQVRASYTTADGLGKGAIRQLRFGSRGTLWAATEGGLNRIKNGHVTTLTSKNGLPCDTVHWSIEDDDHNVWLYMPCGLVRIARSELDAWVSNPKHSVHSDAFDISDGVRLAPALGGWGPHVAKSLDGRIWFPTAGGVGVIDPHHLAFNKLRPPVHIEQITADHQTYNVTSDANGKVYLPPLIRDLEVDYTALSLVAPEKVLFRYKLEGWDRDWQDAGTRRQAFYSNLPPGNYSFHVKACNNSGVWNEGGATLGLNIAPAYYQTRWFLALCIAGALAGLYLLHLRRERQVAEQVRVRMEERLAERERIARDLHDTLLQSVQGLILKFTGIVKRMPREDPVRQEMDRALDRADEALSEGRDRVRSLRSSAESSSELPAAFQRVAEETASSRTVTFKTVVEGVARKLHPVVLEESFCIGREALVNAFSHSGGDHVEVEITYDSRQFRLRVRDDGRGVDPAVVASGARSDHWGLPGMRERARKIGGQLELWSRPGSGTEVELTVPAATAYQDLGPKSKKGWFRQSSATIGE
jgi:signal transduction histidine kinase/ligand-binding sensor domain-containing protein